jgi:hypothetical protein
MFINHSQSILSTHSGGMLGKTNIGTANGKEGEGEDERGRGNKNGDQFWGESVLNGDGGDGGTKRNGNVNVSGVSIGDSDDVDRYGGVRGGAGSSDIEQNGYSNVPGIEVGKRNDASVAPRQTDITVKIASFTNCGSLSSFSILFPCSDLRLAECSYIGREPLQVAPLPAVVLPLPRGHTRRQVWDWY